MKRKLEYKKGKMSKRQALYICWKLWEWLAKTGSAAKGDWPGWKKLDSCDMDCPCCEYTLHIQKTNNCETACPLKSVWPNGCMPDGEETAFTIWWEAELYSGNKIRKQQALIISNGAKKAYEREMRKG